jgi:hypothetical protein
MARTPRGPAPVKALARAFRYQRLLDEGRSASISEMAEAERIERGYLGTLPRLTLLAPNLVETILDGRQLEGVNLPPPLEPFPIAWHMQHAVLPSSTRASRDHPPSPAAPPPEGRARDRRPTSSGAGLADR